MGGEKVLFKNKEQLLLPTRLGYEWCCVAVVWSCVEVCDIIAHLQQPTTTASKPRRRRKRRGEEKMLEIICTRQDSQVACGAVPTCVCRSYTSAAGYIDKRGFKFIYCLFFVLVLVGIY